MKVIPLGTSSLACSRLAYGCWRIAGSWDPSEVSAASKANGRQAVLAAFEAGYTLFDLADIYCGGEAETLFGQVLKEVPGLRRGALIASKCGIRKAGEPKPGSPYRYDFSADHIIHSCEQSLQRLGIETLDLYQLHRPDYLMHPEEVAGAFSQLKQAGKVREFGVSNFRPSQLTALQRACPMRLEVNQVEISLANLSCFEDGTLDQCLGEKLTPMAWSPSVARARGTSRLVVALAWLLKHPAGIVPIVGSARPEKIGEAARAVQMDLSREEWYRLFQAARGEPLP